MAVAEEARGREGVRRHHAAVLQDLLHQQQQLELQLQAHSYSQGREGGQEPQPPGAARSPGGMDASVSHLQVCVVLDMCVCIRCGEGCSTTPFRHNLRNKAPPATAPSITPSSAAQHYKFIIIIIIKSLPQS